MGMVSLALIGYTVFSFLSIESLMASDRWDNNAQEALVEIKQTLALLKDAETGQRGYLLTGEEEYLEPYQHATSLIEKQTARLAALISEDPNQRCRLADLRRLIIDKLEEIRHTVQLRREEGLDSALRVVRTHHGKHVM